MFSSTFKSIEEAPRAPHDLYSLDAFHTDLMMQDEMDEIYQVLSREGSRSFSETDEIGDNTCALYESTASVDDGHGRALSTESARKKRASNMDAVRITHEENLLFDHGLDAWTDEHGKVLRQTNGSMESGVDLSEFEDDPVFRPMLFLQLYGVMPVNFGISGWCYGRIVHIVLFAFCIYYALTSANNNNFFYLRWSPACSCLGSVVGLVALNGQNLNLLVGPGNKALGRYARIQGFSDEWLAASRMAFGVVMALWFTIIAAWGTLAFGADWLSNNSLFSGKTEQMLVFASIACGSGLFAALTFCQLHICYCLEMMVDKFVIHFFEKPDLQMAVREWNFLQAILRRSANAMDGSLLATQTSILAAFVLITAELFAGDGAPSGYVSMLFAIAESPIVVLAFFVLVRGAAVSEKCSRVPALMNTLRLEGSPINFERQYVVQYIEHSGAGFYVKGVRLTTFMVLKLAYGVGVFVFAVATRFNKA
eukprot:TRINITY_DN7688_c0_g1_i1.p2 TRINITY_DN7688_c0_g1~~TRINITY_DN7688_c0_g1_i1.p2  ORF type:complete len:480 (+),score=106.52 TRINITY_DN7688_c0_g1_i1:1730-3169(+)